MLCEELVKAGSAEVNKLLSELTVFNILDRGTLSKEGELQLNDPLAEVTVKVAVLLLVLCLAKYTLDDGLELNSHFRSTLELVDLGVVAFLAWSFDWAKHMFSQLLKFLFKVVGSNNVDDQSDLLSEVLVLTGLG